MNSGSRRSLLICAMFLLSALWLANPALAQNYPAKPVRIIVPFAAGGMTDILARKLAQAISPSLQQTIIIDAKPGASLIIGAEAAARSAPDGYTLFIGSSTSQVINPLIFPKLPYDPVRDFEPIVPISDIEYVLCVNESVPVKTVRELVQYAKDRPGQLNYASYGNGTSVHLGMELFKQVAGIDLVHIPYKGSAPAEQELASGRIQVMITAFSVLNYVKQGRVRVLAVTMAKRSAALPDAPTIAESGYPGFESVSWFGLFAPRGTPKDVVRRWNTEMNKALRSPEIADWLRGVGLEPTGGSTENLAALVQAETAKYKPVVLRSGIKSD